MKNEGLDAFYINSTANVSYFLGTKGDDCSLYITQNKAYIITDFRYLEMAKSLKHLELCLTDTNNTLISIISSFKDNVLGIEKEYLSLKAYLSFKENLSGVILKPVSGLVESLREVKDEEEIECTKKACSIADDAFKYILGVIKPGLTEIECATELEYYMKKHGAEDKSFDTILISGSKTSMPHGVPNSDVIHNNCFVTIDFGCKYHGYCSDMTRTIALGNVSSEMKEIYDIVYKAQNAACEGIKAGLKGSEIDKISRDIITKAGFGEYFGHGLGHGTGLEIHEIPRYSPSYDLEIKENSIVSIEPGIYLPGRFGVRIEDLALVTKNGIINFVTAPKELLII